MFASKTLTKKKLHFVTITSCVISNDSYLSLIKQTLCLRIQINVDCSNLLQLRKNINKDDYALLFQIMTFGASPDFFSFQTFLCVYIYMS